MTRHLLLTTAAAVPLAASGTTLAAQDTHPETGEPLAETQVFKYRLLDQFPTIDPQLIEETAGGHVARQIFEGLLTQNADGTLRPGVATEWSSEDNQTWTFTLRDNAKWSNGDPVTAHDFVYTFHRSIEAPQSYIPLLMPFVDIDSSDLIEVVDDRTFSVSANRPTALLERFLTFQVFAPIDKELAEANSTEEDPWAFDYFVDHNNSSGPYTIADWDRATGEIVLDLNQYYPGEVNNCGVIIKNIPDSEQRVQLLQSGELDVIMGVPPRLLPVL